MTDHNPREEEEFAFPQGKSSDKFLISTPAGPAYIITRKELEDATRRNKADLMQARSLFVAGGIKAGAPALDIDTVIGIKESTKMWPYNR